MPDVNRTTDSDDLTNSEVNTTSQTKAEIDKIIFRCFDQGVYWGKLAYSENERPDKPESPIDRTEAISAIQSIVQAAEVRARISELKKLPTRQKNDFYQIEIDPDFVTSHVADRLDELTEQAEVSL
jgi:hypothetical protein